MTLLRPNPEISYTARYHLARWNLLPNPELKPKGQMKFESFRKRGSYNAVLNDSGAAGDSVACMEHDGVGVSANGTSDIATFHRLVHRRSYPWHSSSDFANFFFFFFLNDIYECVYKFSCNFSLCIGVLWWRKMKREKKVFSMEVEEDSYCGTCEKWCNGEERRGKREK